MPGNFCSRKNSIACVSQKKAHTLDCYANEQSILLTSSSICSHFVHSSSKFVFSAKSAIFDFLKRKKPRALFRTLFDPYPKITAKILRRFFFLGSTRGNWEKSQQERKSSPSYASIDRSVKWNSFRIFSWISFYCVRRNADQGKVDFFSVCVHVVRKFQGLVLICSFLRLHVRYIKARCICVCPYRIFDLSYERRKQVNLRLRKVLLGVFFRISSLWFSFSSNRSADLAPFHFGSKSNSVKFY